MRLSVGVGDESGGQCRAAITLLALARTKKIRLGWHPHSTRHLLSCAGRPLQLKGKPSCPLGIRPALQLHPRSETFALRPTWLPCKVFRSILQPPAATSIARWSASANDQLVTC
ncbi:hypothetical protein BAUCODRAFT_221382 [Baudoinia panamericana UAMH 10762]|uniref:Uncharacterized protein n=1 Tax=Baudoinia panamericana (strain UAMH 10762) TaxID=717646 RepID=M2MRM1_BAUPA|nr:uncharacterized protein BAUCODRAFT_221382 [Baudoinia panamericana UAMH 10762]EMC94123.1 hypothetical protein BAUCODRAFT_221382 [Baudoinia panamericana UAMH 10762]